jgi:hypothetical protein
MEVMRRPILNHTSLGEAVYDRFGPGTTLIAAEQTGRLFRCGARSVIRRRDHSSLAAVHGQKGVVDGDGRPFDEIAEERRRVA